VAFKFLGLTIGDDGTGFQMPTYAESVSYTPLPLPTKRIV